jgi:DivIVA domain-containing protein
MAQFLLLLIGALVVGAIVFGVVVLVTGKDGLGAVEPDGRSVPLPVARPLVEADFGSVRFDTALRGYRMAQVDHALRRAAYDIGYKNELIQVLEAEVTALRDGRIADADVLGDARRTALGNTTPEVGDNRKPAEPPREGDQADQVVSDSPVPASEPTGEAGSEATPTPNGPKADAGRVAPSADRDNAIAPTS